MSEPAIFVLIRDGNTRYYGDRWAFTHLFRELVWGPEDLETWLTHGEEIDDWSDEVSGGVVVDFDQKRLTWMGDDETLKIPRVANSFETLLRASWPGYEISFANRGIMDLAAAAGEPDAEDYDDDSATRCSTVQDAVGIYMDGDEASEYDEEDQRAWITVIDEEGAVRHRAVEEVSEDLIGGRESSLQQLLDLPAAEVPTESVVVEGMWIDQPNREIGFWGGHAAKMIYPQMQGAWEGWSVKWADKGYADQCAVSGPSGITMSDAEALGGIVPIILSTKRFDMGTLFGAMGGQIKKTAIKATGCLLMVLCAPVLIFGAISGNWQATLITIAVVTILIALAFKVIEYKLKRKFSMDQFVSDQEDAAGQERPAVAGPTNERQRKEKLASLLQAAGLPSLSEIEPHYVDDDVLDLL